jgi:FkbM family methyltransferase
MHPIKNYLTSHGPDSSLMHLALGLNARLRGFRVKFADDCISIMNNNKEMLLNKDLFVQVPLMMRLHGFYFDSIVSEQAGGRSILDFSQPGLHEYKKSGVSLYFPGIPEDDVMDLYTAVYIPKPGDIVWDAGAHAGATSYFLSKMVGPTGKVFSFEPDDLAFEYLQRNIEMHQLTNVVPVKKALSGETGTATFSMDGSMAAGIQEYIVYVNRDRLVKVPTLTIQDACEELGAVPAYAKMDIEGAEVAAIEGSLDFLKVNPVHFGIESDHVVNGETTSKALDRLFPTIGYQVRSSNELDIMFTWATPPAH